jgi:GntR family transcriptional regulator
LGLGTPILTVTRIAYTDDGAPLEINDMVMAGDRYELIYEFSAQ